MAQMLTCLDDLSGLFTGAAGAGGPSGGVGEEGAPVGSEGPAGEEDSQRLLLEGKHVVVIGESLGRFASGLVWKTGGLGSRLVDWRGWEGV